MGNSISLQLTIEANNSQCLVSSYHTPGLPEFEMVGLFQIYTHSACQVKPISELPQGLVFTRLLLMDCCFFPPLLEANFNPRDVYWVKLCLCCLGFTHLWKVKAGICYLQHSTIRWSPGYAWQEERREQRRLLSMLEKLKRSQERALYLFVSC